MPDLIVPIAMFLMIFGIVYVSVTTRNRERMALIEKGLDVSVFKNPARHDNNLKWGLVAVGIAAGMIVGNIIGASYDFNENIQLTVSAMPFLFGGIALITFYLLTKKKYS